MFVDTKKVKKTITYTSKFVNLVNNRLVMEIGFTNIQNKIFSQI